MPGSTTSSGDPKAKATADDAGVSNGIFVRPVAVAGIFRPAAAEGVKPALPEKRRFSALVGDLRPCSTDGPADQDFARRRQSWDTRVKEVPFGQNLLKKTPRKSSTDSGKNGTLGLKDSESGSECNPSALKLPIVSEDSAASRVQQNYVTNSHSETISQHVALKSEHQKNIKKDSSEPKGIAVGNKSSVNENKDAISSVNSNHFVKVSDEKRSYSKRITPSTEQIETAAESSQTNKIQQKSFSSESGEKGFRNNSGGISSKLKPVTQADTKQVTNASKVTESSTVKNEINFGDSKIATKLGVESSAIKSGNVSDSKAIIKVDTLQIKKDKLTLNTPTVNRTHDVNSNITNEINPPDIKKVSVNKHVEHLSENDRQTFTRKAEVSKSVQNCLATETRQTKKVYGLMKRDSKVECTQKIETTKFEDSSLSTSTLGTTEISDSAKIKSKIYGLTNANKKDDNISDTPKQYPKVSDGNIKSTSNHVVTAEISDKAVSKTELPQQEIKKAESPPKNVRIVRRTSDVIAAKIQNIFSNFGPEKTAATLPKKYKCVDKDKSNELSKQTSFGKNNELIQNSSELARKPNDHTTTSTKISDERKTESKGEVKHLSSQTNVISDKKEQITTENQKKILVNDKTLHSPIDRKEPISKLSLSTNEKPKVSVEDKEIKISVEKSCDKSEKNLKSSVKTSNLKALEELSSEIPKSVAQGGIKENINKIPVTAASRPNSKIESERVEKGNDSKSDNINTSSVSEKIGSRLPTKTSDVNNLQLNQKQIAKIGSESSQKSLKDTNERIVSDTSTFVVKNKSLDHTVGKEIKTMTSTVENALSNDTKKWSVPSKNSENLSSKSNETVTSKNSLSQSVISTKENIMLKATVSSTRSSVVSSIKSSTVSSTKSSAVVSTNKSIISKALEATEKLTNGSVEPKQASKVEITRICTSPVQGIVPTVNVLFRTKSPQNSSVKDENRKMVIIESSPVKEYIAESVKHISKSGQEATASAKELKSIEEAMKTVEDVQKSLNVQPKTSVKHSVINLDKQEVASLNLSSTDEANSRNSPVMTKPNCEIQVVDLGDWNKKFQRADAELPRVPLRRRATSRDSLPPVLPLRSSVGSKFGSLRRIEDSPRYISRSPSQSSLPPQRYSYTEMLSKVCSMGVLPPARSSMDLAFSKSCSSSSSQVSELWSELSEEQSTATHASEMLEAETTERMRLEKEVSELQNRYSHIQQKSDKMELEMMEARVYRSSEFNGDLSEDEDAEGNNSLYKQKYERAVRDMEIMKRRIQQQHEEEMEQKTMLKKASDKRLAESLEDVEEERQVANQWKRKAQKLGSELQDLRLMLEEQMARNGELEKKQRRFDAELSTAQEEIKKERLLREKLSREKDQALHEKYSIEQDLQSAKLDMDMQHEKLAQLNRELDELTLSSKGEEEVTQLKRVKQELERKSRDQEEELEELAAQVQMLEQAKLRLEMSLEKLRQEHRREASVREEEIEEIRASFSKKIKNLEAQLEAEQDERHQLVKQKHELERHLYELTDQPPPQDPEMERRLRRDLKRTKALLRDAQSMLEHTREGQANKTVIRQLKNQLEDAEFAKAAAIKARQAADCELQELQLHLEEMTRTKNDTETRCLQLSREKSAIQTQLEEAEEEMAEVMKKYKAVVAQMSIDQKSIAEQNQQISELESERQMLKDQLSEVSHKFEHLAGQSEDTHKIHRLDSKVRELDSKLELEQTTRARLEHQITRLKEQNDRTREECDSLRNKELQAQEGIRWLQRQIRDSREDYTSLQQKEADAYRKQHELEMALENADTDLQVTKNDLRLACQRIQDLQNALEDDLDSGTDVPDDSGSDSDSSMEMMRSMTPVQRCDSAASDYGQHSRTSSFSRELSAFSRMMLRKTSTGFLG